MDWSYEMIEQEERKGRYADQILRSLPAWFGDEQSIKEYVENVKALPFFAAMDRTGSCLGFFSVKIHYNLTGDLYVCGILPEQHRKGIGGELYRMVENYLIAQRCRYVIVKTLSDTDDYEPYKRTRTFYKKMGFTELITLTEMWDEDNPCLIMIKDISKEPFH